MNQQELEELQKAIQELENQKLELVKSKCIPLYRVVTRWDSASSSHIQAIEEIWVYKNFKSSVPGDDDWIEPESECVWGARHGSNVNPKDAIDKYVESLQANCENNQRRIKELLDTPIEELIKRGQYEDN